MIVIVLVTLILFFLMLVFFVFVFVLLFLVLVLALFIVLVLVCVICYHLYHYHYYYKLFVCEGFLQTRARYIMALLSEFVHGSNRITDESFPDMLPLGESFFWTVAATDTFARSAADLAALWTAVVMAVHRSGADCPLDSVLAAVDDATSAFRPEKPQQDDNKQNVDKK